MSRECRHPNRILTLAGPGSFVCPDCDVQVDDPTGALATPPEPADDPVESRNECGKCFRKGHYYVNCPSLTAEECADPADTEAAAVWERLSKPQREHLLRLCGWGVTPGGDRSIHGFVAARVYNNLSALALVVVYADETAGPRRVKWTDLGRRVAERGRKAGGR